MLLLPSEPKRSALKMNLIDTWYKGKLSRQHCTLQKQITVTEEYRVHTGGRSIYAEVCLFAKPNKCFEYISLVEWPDSKHSEIYDEYVLHGVLDILFTYSIDPILGISVTLKKIGWDEKESCAIGFYHAACMPTKKIIQPNTDEWNFK